MHWTSFIRFLSFTFLSCWKLTFTSSSRNWYDQVISSRILIRNWNSPSWYNFGLNIWVVLQLLWSYNSGSTVRIGLDNSPLTLSRWYLILGWISSNRLVIVLVYYLIILLSSSIYDSNCVSTRHSLVLILGWTHLLLSTLSPMSLIMRLLTGMRISFLLHK